MAVENVTASRGTAVPRAPIMGHGMGGDTKTDFGTGTLPAASDIGSTVHIHRVPSNARIMAGSFIENAALGASATLNIGVFGDQITDNATAFNSGIDGNTAGRVNLFSDVTAAGQEVWRYATSPPETDPGGMIDIKVTTAGAVAAGAISSELKYVLGS